MPELGCPAPEEWATFASGSVSEEEWRRGVRHLSECAGCRRHLSLLSQAAEGPLPAPRLSIRPPAVAAARRSRIWRNALRAVAAVLVLGTMAYALWLMNRSAPRTETVGPKSAPPPEDLTAGPSPERPKPHPPKPFWPDRPTPEPREKVPGPRNKLPPPPRPDRDAPTEPPSPGAPEPAGSSYLAQRSARGVVEAVEVSPGAGRVSVVFAGGIRPLSHSSFVTPSQPLRSAEGGSFLLPDGATVHLPREGEVAVGWSQTLWCYSLDLRHGSALVDLGPAPRVFHVASGPTGFRVQESSGQLWLSAGESSLRATPMSGGASFRAPTGESRMLETKATLVLGADKDWIELTPDLDARLKESFPTLDATPPKPPAPPAAKPEIPPPSLGDLVKSLGAESYRYRVSGRYVREGTWSPAGILVSTIDDSAVAKRTNAQSLHIRRGNRPWDEPGPSRPAAHEERVLETLRGAQPPHSQLERALASVRGEPQVRQDVVRELPSTLWLYSLDPAVIQNEVNTLIEMAIAEGRMERPQQTFWDTLEGKLEIAVARIDSKVLRAIDRRRVQYTYKSTTPGLLLRRSYNLETRYEFHDHGKAAPPLPAKVLKELEAGK